MFGAAGDMRIGVLETGEVPEDLRARHGDYPAMFARLLDEADPGLRLEPVRVVQGEMPAGPNAADGWIVSGSRHAVYEDHAWIAPLKAFLRACLERRVPVLGICFGHQILAEAAGGRVEKAASGWCAGADEYEIVRQPAHAPPLPPRLLLRTLHQDQVVRPPHEATVIARSRSCAYAGFAYGDPDAPRALGLQGHPEFTSAFLDDLIAFRAGAGIPEAVAEAARASLAHRVETRLWSAWIAGFFRAAQARQTRSGR